MAKKPEVKPEVKSNPAFERMWRRLHEVASPVASWQEGGRDRSTHVDMFASQRGCIILQYSREGKKGVVSWGLYLEADTTNSVAATEKALEDFVAEASK